MENQKLAQYFKFDGSDLQANRNGKITEKQLSRIKSNFGLGKFLILIVGLAILAGTSQPVISLMRSGKTTIPLLWIVPAASLLIGLAIDGWLLRRLMMKDQYQLGKVEGHANIVTTSGSRTTYYELHVGGQEFDVDEGIIDIMIQGGSYTVYYIKEYNDVLSVEESPGAK
jgi:hypothetical protein